MKLLNIWTLVLLLSILIATVMALSLPDLVKSRKLVEQGSLVEVQVVGGSESSFGKRHMYNLHFIYEGKRHSVQVGRDYLARVKALQSTKLLHLPEYPGIFLSPDYDASGQFTSAIVLIILSAFIGVYSGVRVFRTEA
jgi:hypothetical protein